MRERFDITNGLVREYNYAVPGTFLTRPAPTLAEVIWMRSPGVESLVMNGERGTIDLTFTVGTAGTAQAVAFLTDRTPTPTRFLGIGLDSSNRPHAYIMGHAGTEVGVFALADEDIPAGTRLHITLTWDAEAAVDGSRFAMVQLDGVVMGTGWTTNPVATWVPFTPTTIVVGDLDSASFESLGSFTGTIERVVVLRTTLTPPASGEETFDFLFSDAAVVSDAVILATANFGMVLSDSGVLSDEVTTLKS